MLFWKSRKHHAPLFNSVADSLQTPSHPSCFDYLTYKTETKYFTKKKRPYWDLWIKYFFADHQPVKWTWQSSLILRQWWTNLSKLVEVKTKRWFLQESLCFPDDPLCKISKRSFSELLVTFSSIHMFSLFLKNGKMTEEGDWSLLTICLYLHLIYTRCLIAHVFLGGW